MKRTTRRTLANAGAVLLLAAAFFVSLTGFRRPPGWVGVAQRITFASENARIAQDETHEDDGATTDVVIVDPQILRREIDAIRASVQHRVQPDWTYLPPSAQGSYVRTRWCGPPLDAAACALPALEDAPSRAGDWIELDLVRDAASPQRDVGYLYRARVHSGDLAITVSYARGGGRVIRPGFSIEVTPSPDAAEGEALRLGATLDLRVAPLRCVVSAPGLRTHDGAAREAAIRAELLRLVESPGSFRETANARLVDLLEHAETALHEREIRSTQCSFVVPVEGDRAPVLEQARRIIDARQSVVDEHADLIHALLTQALPPGMLADGSN